MSPILCLKDEDENSLAHYRTKGSKNGVRRWQNEDGTYTQAGKIHYGIGDGREAKRQWTFSNTSKRQTANTATSESGKTRWTFSNTSQSQSKASTGSTGFRKQGRKTNVTGQAKVVTIGQKYGADEEKVFQSISRKLQLSKQHKGQANLGSHADTWSEETREGYDSLLKEISDLFKGDEEKIVSYRAWLQSLTDGEMTWLIGRYASMKKNKK